MRTLRRAFYIERLREGRGQPALRQGVDLESTAKALHAAACRRPHASSVNPGGRDYPRTRSSNIHQSTGRKWILKMISLSTDGVQKQHENLSLYICKNESPYNAASKCRYLPTKQVLANRQCFR